MVGPFGAALLAFAASAVRARGAAAPAAYMLQLTGACRYQDRLNGAVYLLAGASANGSPYYKVDGLEEYMYFDADCDGGGDGMPRWILDTDRPVPGNLVDLDNDHACVYHGRTNNFDGTHPPLFAVWKMKCGEGWSDRFVRFVSITTTSTQSSTTKTSTATTTTETSTGTSTTVTSTVTETTTTQTGTSTTPTTATATTTTATHTGTSTTATSTVTGSSTTHTKTVTTTGTAATNTSTTETVRSTPSTSTAAAGGVETLVLEGACKYKSFLNGMHFVYQGIAASGGPYYKAASMEQYIYYDLDCNGGGDGHPLPRWIIDDDAPNITLSEDLDEDRACDYHARLEVGGEHEASAGPPIQGEWRMFCGEGWESLHLRLGREPCGHPPRERADVLYLAGACPEQGHLNGLGYEKQGLTVRGAPYYKALGEEQYLYHDPSCDGDGAEPRWILDTSAPNATLDSDLDADGACDYVARVSSVDSSGPPSRGTWRMLCGHGWRDVRLTFSEEAPRTTTATTTRAHLVISGAAGAALSALALAPTLLLGFLLV